ncbi:MAG: hypothetical protein IIC85_00915, partial [Chloroflexi bacterium]|nr:hypothetical protein [Chloroflexota bacterium]
MVDRWTVLTSYEQCRHRDHHDEQASREGRTRIPDLARVLTLRPIGPSLSAEGVNSRYGGTHGEIEMKRFNTVAWASTLSLALVACSDGTAPDGIDDRLNFDVAMVAADGLLDDLSTITQLFPFGSGASLAPSVTRSRVVEFFDGAGNLQEAYDELTTASMHIVSEMSGEFTRENWSATIARTRDMIITGLEGEET